MATRSIRSKCYEYFESLQALINALISCVVTEAASIRNEKAREE